MSFMVRLTLGAEADLEALFAFNLERALAREGCDLSLSGKATTALRAGLATSRCSRSRASRT